MNLPIRNSRIKLSQGQLFWREVGRGDAAIVFLHGSWHDSEQWKPVIEQLSLDYHCFAPDLLGFGESEQPAMHYSVRVELESLAEYLAALKLRRFYLVGHSLGGWVAARYALCHPEQVAGLVLLAPEGVEAPGRKHRWQGTRLLLLPIAGGILRSLNSLNRLFKSSKIFRLLQRRRQLLNATAACQILFQRRWAEVKAELLHDKLQNLNIPTLILQGEHDSADAIILNQTYARLAPQSDLIQISQAGSDLPQLHPTAVAASIREFVGKVKVIK